MIKPKALSEVLASVCTGGINTALIAHTDGSLLAFYGPSEKDAHAHLAIVANTWSVYEKNEHTMKSILIEVEDSSILLLRITSTLAICLIAENSVELGILRQKGKSLRNYLEGPLSQI